ncbi:Hemin ABC transporter, permease protein [Labilithrix luteola]|uniref:Hemin ABC transporter, permease protein n=1 Tax=Labilithrix luteola TaxID=1391654 RepID=A0A0K1QAW4_9BACT|nr:iron ABC transporter permease [Labilithrix luteola]AKV02802.1 Hemin ABC transporter, permease protein [Labilithrix luteola]
MIDARRRRGVLGGLLVLFLVTLAWSATIGGVPIPVSDVFRAVFAKVGLSADVDATTASVLFGIRAPRLVLGVLVGAALAMSGAALQGLFRNALADPALLGISSGAALGAVSAIVLGASIASALPAWLAPYLLPTIAFVGAMASMVVVQRIARDGFRTAVSMLLLAGIAINALCQATMGLLVYTATDAQLRNITFWNLGSLGGATWGAVWSAGPFLVIALVALPRFARSLDAIVLGEAEAGHLGFSVERVKRVVFAIVALAVGASVAVSGILGFVGLVVPHLLRLALGPSHRTLIVAAGLCGASLLLLADAFARTVVAPAELPLGIVTAAIGTPFFLALLLREKRTRTA